GFLCCVVFIVGFFTKLIVRLFRWSSRHDWKGNTNLFSRRDDVPVDYNHSIRLQKIHGHRIQVTITQRKYLEAEEGIKLSYPSPHICSKIKKISLFTPVKFGDVTIQNFYDLTPNQNPGFATALYVTVFGVP
ncbi:hypothetical protein AVEN_257397-1, partial [Araneus ventricosus]